MDKKKEGKGRKRDPGKKGGYAFKRWVTASELRTPLAAPWRKRGEKSGQSVNLLLRRHGGKRQCTETKEPEPKAHLKKKKALKEGSTKTNALRPVPRPRGGEGKGTPGWPDKRNLWEFL